MPTERIQYGWSLRRGTDELNKAIDAANAAEVLSTNANSKATQALSNSEQTQTELTQAILAGDSSPLGGQLSVGAEGTVYAGPQERLLAEYNGLTADLAKIAFIDVDSHVGTDSQKLNAFLSARSGSTVRIPRGLYTLDETVVIPENTIVEAKGVKFQTPSHITVVKIESGVRLSGLEIEGAGNISTNFNGVGINLQGASSSDYVNDIILTDLYVHDIGSYGILGEFAENVEIQNSKIENVGYAGIAGLSVKSFNVKKCHVKGISPGSMGNAYGVFLTRKITDSLLVYPASANCIVDSCLIEDNTLWEALDTHAGINITFSNNTIRNCKYGVIITNDGSGGNPPIRCKALNNDVIGIATGTGIFIAGDTVNKALLCEAQGNTLFECGEQTNLNSAGIMVQYSIGCIISNNLLRHCYSNGIHMNLGNTGFNVSGNTIVDVQDTVNNVCAGIAMRQGENNGCISNNTLLRINDALNVYVSEMGIYVRSAAVATTRISIGVNYNNYVIPLNGVDGLVADYGAFTNNNVRFYAGVGSPEGVITANIGSIFLRRDGGAATSFYVKESGTGNTGWVAK